MKMYGSEQTDLVVKYYDLAFGISGEAELAWYLGQAKMAGGPVLDLACGTGRLAVLRQATLMAVSHRLCQRIPMQGLAS